MLRELRIGSVVDLFFSRPYSRLQQCICMKECSLSWYQELVHKKVFVLNLFLGSFLKIPSPDNAMLVKISFLDHRDGFFWEHMASLKYSLHSCFKLKPFNAKKNTTQSVRNEFQLFSTSLIKKIGFFAKKGAQNRKNIIEKLRFTGLSI